MKQENQHPKDIKLAYRVAYLLAGYVKQNLTEVEQQELEVWKNENDHNKKLFVELTDEKNIRESLADYSTSDPDNYLAKSKEQLSFFRQRKVSSWWMYTAAASIVIAILGILYFKPFSKKDGQSEIVAIDSTDIQPGYSQATLTLANGQIISLRTEQNDTTINGIATLHARQGELDYSATATDVEFHTLTIPRKGFYKLKLPDETIVYLNAESSISYPTAFTGKERKVKVTGETYFEVAPDKEKPFRVEAEGMQVEALGTAFNVNAYLNETTISTTLVEGSVKISGVGDPVILQPGQQAQLANGTINVINSSTGAITGWKDNRFVFSNTPIDIIMRKLARWYDAEIVYQEKVNVALNATIDRNVKLSKILELLSKTNEVHFKTTGNKIIVMK